MYELDKDGFLIADLPGGNADGFDHWSAVPFTPPMNKPQLKGTRNKLTGEWTGEWIDAEPPKNTRQAIADETAEVYLQLMLATIGVRALIKTLEGIHPEVDFFNAIRGQLIADLSVPLWDAGTAYTKGNVVRVGESFWIALTDNTGTEPRVGSIDWTLD